MNFYKCNTCKNIIIHVKDEKVPVSCCREVMTKLIPNTTDAANEKHVPVVTKNGNNVLVKVGSVEHPMLEVHYIEWIVLETNKGYYIKHLYPNESPNANFNLEDDEEIIAAYEHCNLHGLWKGQL